MTISHVHRRFIDAVLFINRAVIGLYFLLAGSAKIDGGLRSFYEGGFAMLRPGWLPDWFALPYAYALPFLECAAGLAVLLGFLTRLSAGVMAVMLASFTIAIALAGHFFSGPGPFHSNLVFLSVAMLLVCTGPGRFSLHWLGQHLYHRPPTPGTVNRTAQPSW